MNPDLIWQVVAGLIPSIGIGFIFYRVVKALVEADRNERRAVAQMEADQAERAGMSGDNHVSPHRS